MEQGTSPLPGVTGVATGRPEAQAWPTADQPPSGQQSTQGQSQHTLEDVPFLVHPALAGSTATLPGLDTPSVYLNYMQNQSGFSISHTCTQVLWMGSRGF